MWWEMIIIIIIIIMASSVPPRERGDEVFCPHCGRDVAKKTYRMHKRMYFDPDTDQWVKRKAPDDQDIS